MSVRIQIFIIVVCVIFFLYVANLLRKKKIDFKYALGWLALGLIILFLAAFPNVLAWISTQIGIASPVNMLFFFGLCLSLCMIFSQSVSLSHANDSIKKLTQELAILKKTIYEDEMRNVYEEKEMLKKQEKDCTK